MNTLSTLSPITLAVVGLRAAALGLAVAGQTVASRNLYAVADAVEAGRATDDHMREVAQKLKDGASDDEWDDVTARINAGSDRLQSSSVG